MNNKEEEEEEEYDICIIGGGLGGLSSINNLLESSKINLKIVLLEGRNRIGGRTNTIQLEQLEQQIKEQNKEEQILEQLEEQKEQLEVQREQREEEEKKEEEEDNNKKNCYVDIGGQWIGTDHFKALSFISKYSLKLEEQIYPHYNSNNNNENESHLLDSLVSMVSYQFPNLTNEEEEEINYFVKLIDELGSKLSLDTPWNIENASEMDVSIYDYVLKIISLPRAQQEIFIFIQTILATSPHDCSFLFFLYYIASGGGMRALGDGLHGAQRWKVIGGAQKISEKLLDDFLTRNNNQHTFKCYLSTPVRSISYIKDDNENNSNKLLVTTSNNLKEIKIKCKRIIIAMSPRLSNSTIQFNPPLPEPKQSLTNAMVPGACVKVLIPYYNEFWLSGINNHPIKGLKSLEEIYPMHNMFHSTVGPYSALVGLITGDHAKSYIKLNEQEKRQALLNQIHDLFCSPNPEYSDIEKSPAFYPIDIIEKSWINEPFSGGCFACLFRPNYFLNYGPYLKTPLGFPVPNSENNSELNWVTPLIDENIQYETAIEWASTETAPMFSGYMEGAILAGEEAAKRILSSL